MLGAVFGLSLVSRIYCLHDSIERTSKQANARFRRRNEVRKKNLYLVILLAGDSLRLGFNLNSQYPSWKGFQDVSFPSSNNEQILRRKKSESRDVFSSLQRTDHFRPLPIQNIIDWAGFSGRRRRFYYEMKCLICLLLLKTRPPTKNDANA